MNSNCFTLLQEPLWHDIMLCVNQFNDWQYVIMCISSMLSHATFLCLFWRFWLLIITLYTLHYLYIDKLYFRRFMIDVMYDTCIKCLQFWLTWIKSSNWCFRLTVRIKTYHVICILLTFIYNQFKMSIYQIIWYISLLYEIRTSHLSVW